MSSPKRRIETDVMKLMMTDHEVTLINDSMMEFYVSFKGPKDSPYEGGVWKVRCELPEAYPYKSPSIGFINKIFHPNIDEAKSAVLSLEYSRSSGSVCLDVINQTWSPMFDLLNVFETFLPQLLAYPNPADPLNGEAAALLMREPEKYKTRVREYVNKYATEEALRAQEAQEHDGESELSEMEDLTEDEDDTFEMDK